MKTLLAASAMMLAAGAANADGYRHSQDQYDYARVLEASPITRSVREPVNREVCWDEDRIHEERPNVGGSTLLGGVIGGVIGNQFGSGSGRAAATAAGAMIGGAIGNDQASKRPTRRWRETREHCRVEREWRHREEVVGYHVTYEYDGDVYSTRMAHHPGDSVRVRVAVTPVE